MGLSHLLFYFYNVKRSLFLLIVVSTWLLFYSAYQLIFSQTWIESGILFIFSGTMLTSISCLYFIQQYNHKIPWLLWLIAIVLITLSTIQLFSTEQVSHLWNYEVAGLIGMIAYTLMIMLNADKIIRILLASSSLVISGLFILKIEWWFNFNLLLILAVVFSVGAIAAGIKSRNHLR